METWIAVVSVHVWVCPHSTQVSKRSSCDDASRDDAGRDDSYSSLDLGVLKIVTCLAWENISNRIICVGASCSYLPLLCAPGTTCNNCQSTLPEYGISHEYNYIYCFHTWHDSRENDGQGGGQFIAATCSGQSLAEENQLPAGGGVSSAWLCSPLLLVSVLLAACRLL